MRPQYVVFPKDANGFAIDDQFYIGSFGLLVKPVTNPRVTEVSIYLADDQAYYDYFDSTIYHGTQDGGVHVNVPAPLAKVPLLIRGGHIVPTRQRPRRSSPLMKNDPFTLTVAMSSSSSTTGGNDEIKAFGELYMDDGETYAHTRGELIWRGFTLSRTQGKSKKRSTPKVFTLKSRDLVRPALAKGEPIVETTNSFTTPTTTTLKVGASVYDAEDNAFAKSMADVVHVERIVILGIEGRPSSVRVGDQELEFTYFEGVSAGKARTKTRTKTKGSEGQGEGEWVASKLVIKKPQVSIVKDWDVVIAL